MTRAHSKVHRRLLEKQVNKEDVIVVEYNDTYATFYVAFPGLYLTYDRWGKLARSQTTAERILAGDQLAFPDLQGNLTGEIGS